MTSTDVPATRRPLLNVLCGDEEVEALLSDDAQMRAMLSVEAALAEAGADAGIVRADAAEAIVKSIALFAPDWDELAIGMARDGVVVPALVVQLRRAVGEQYAADVHRGATSQDIVDTALMLQLSQVVRVLLARLDSLEEKLAVVRSRFGAQKLMAHTRMQVALEFTVADKLRTWTEPLLRHRQALSTMRRELLVIQLGGPVGDRSSFAWKGYEIARGLAERLDLGLAPSWHSTRDPIVGFGSRLAMLAGSLGKFGADVAFMAQNEVTAITLASAGGSSAMPHKSNPVQAEVLVALARHAAGLAGTLQQAMVHENERSGSAWTLEWLTLPQLAVTTAAGLRLGNELVESISFPGAAS